MKQVERAEVMGMADYETIRDRFRARVIQEKKGRRVFLGDRASCVFENHDTVLLQIQEMLRTERITREASIQHEIDTYNELIPKEHELSATILIEIEDKATRDAFLSAAVGLEKTFSLVVDGHACPGKVDPSREDATRTTAVHYVKFDLAAEAERRLRDVLAKKVSASDVVMELASSHPEYRVAARLPAALVASLAEDLAP
ncbi:MAG: DUF3501 family protein [Labilithrix sp.]|nr:DUF3501 family protein [Labilithrix sp.]MCW5816314.1 DUF3501 family protein [Labilithrix sp.]